MKYIDSEKLIAEIIQRKDWYLANADKIKNDDTDLSVFYEGRWQMCDDVIAIIDSLQQEQPMPDSTQLIELWNEDKEMLKEKDFRDDAWRLAYNAFMCGFGRGLAVKRQEQPEY